MKGVLPQAGRIQASTSDQAGPPRRAPFAFRGALTETQARQRSCPPLDTGPEAIRLMRRDRHVAARAVVNRAGHDEPLPIRLAGRLRHIGPASVTAESGLVGVIYSLATARFALPPFSATLDHGNRADLLSQATFCSSCMALLDSYPVLLLHALLLPINISKIVQLVRKNRFDARVARSLKATAHHAGRRRHLRVAAGAR
jgi:hypothetical protein